MPGFPDTVPAPELPPGPRLALVIATAAYEDPGLRRLVAPAHDAAALAQVLADPAVGGFAVVPVADGSEREIRLAVEDFLAGRGTRDLLLVYLSCHGLLDEHGRLFFAARDTRKDRLGATAVEAAWVLDRLEHSRARRQVLVLDSCFSGAFARGAKGDADVGLRDRFAGHGRGRVVLTASSATQYSFEGDPVGLSAVQGSVFTAALVAGLRTGAADADRDGFISVDEAYAYAFERVRAQGAAQTPQRWLFGAEGSIVLARSTAGRAVIPAPLPESLRMALDSPHPQVRVGAVHELGAWLTSQDPARVLTAIAQLNQVADGDIPRVAGAARSLLAVGQHTERAGPDAGDLNEAAREDIPADPGPGDAGPREDRDPLGQAARLREDTHVDQGTLTRQIAGSRAGPRGRIREWPGSIRSRLPILGLLCAICAAAVAIPLILASPAIPRTPGAARSSTSRTPGAAASNPATAPALSGPLTAIRTAALPDPGGGGVDSVAFGPAGTMLAAGGGNGTTYLWYIATRKITATLPDPGGRGVDSVAFGPAGTILAAGDDNGSTYLWDTTAPKINTTLPDPVSGAGGVLSVAFGPRGTTLAAGYHDGSTYLWDIATQKITATLPDPGSDGVDSVAFGPGGKTLAAGDGNGTTYLWDISTSKITATLPDPGSRGVQSVAFGPGGKTLAAGDGNGTTYLWDIATQKNTIALPHPVSSGGVFSVAFGPGGTALAEGQGGATYLWDIAARKITASLYDPGGSGVVSVAFGPGGTTLATGDINGSTYLWHITRSL